MTLVEVRTWFIRLTGRNDLAVIDPTTAMPLADFFIQAGQDFLDRRYNFPADRGVIPVTIVAGDFSADLSNVRAIKNIWVVAEDGIHYLMKESVEQLHARLEDEGDFSEVERGVPQYYAIGIMRDATPVLLEETQKRIIFLPPADAGMTLNIEALLLSPALTTDASVSFWTSIMPHTLIQAAWYMVERFYRNREGMNDHLMAIELDLVDLDFDTVEEDIANIHQMKNSWGGNNG